RGDDRRRGVRVELRRAGFREAGLGPGVLDDHALQSQAQAQRRDVLLARVADGPDLAFDATDAEPARDAHAVDVAQLGSGALGGGALVGGYPADTYPRVVGEAARAQRLGDRQVRIGQIDVLAHQGDRDFVTWMMHAAQQLVPGGPVDVAEGQPEAFDHVGIEALGVQHLRDVVDGRGVDGGHDGFEVDVAHQRDLALDTVGDRPVRAAHDGVG